MLLVDGDVVVYRAAREAEKAGLDISLYIDWSIETLTDGLCNDEPYLLFLSGGENFRNKIAVTKPYKGNRKKENRPALYQETRDLIISKYAPIVCDGYEADDGMAMYQYERLHELSTIICSIDKDLLTVPGYHITFKKGEGVHLLVEDFGDISYEDGHLTGTGKKFFYAQCIMGDPVDNIPGLPRWGAKKAFDKLFSCKNEKDCYKTVSETYISMGKDENYLREQANLLWIVRERNSDGTLKLWEPIC